MERRSFIGRTLAGGALLGGTAGVSGVQPADAKQSDHMIFAEDIRIESDVPGKPHKGKVFAAIQPHADDIPIFAAGLVAKLIKEGYTGYLINTTNDDCYSGPMSVGESVIENEHDSDEVARVLGLKKVFHLGYRNHRMDGVNPLEFMSRLVFLFRALKVDTVISFDHWAHYDINPDHFMTARAVEAASWMARGNKDFPEHFKIGLKPQEVPERYHHALGPQLINCVVDISSVIERKIRANMANKAQGPAGNAGVNLRETLAKENKKLPILGDTDETANYQYAKNFLLEDEKKLGKKFGVEYAEAYHYVDIRWSEEEYAPTLKDYIKKHSVTL